jgi:hypothetical protein
MAARGVFSKLFTTFLFLKTRESFNCAVFFEAFGGWKQQLFHFIINNFSIAATLTSEKKSTHKPLQLKKLLQTAAAVSAMPSLVINNTAFPHISPP